MISGLLHKLQIKFIEQCLFAHAALHNGLNQVHMFILHSANGIT